MINPRRSLNGGTIIDVEGTMLLELVLINVNQLNVTTSSIFYPTLLTKSTYTKKKTRQVKHKL